MRTNKRVSHHVNYNRDMSLIFGKKKTPEVAEKTEKKVIGPSNDKLEQLTARRDKFKKF